MWSDAEYPEVLRQIIDAPLLLYFSGQLSLPRGPAVGVVGARDCTREGIAVSAFFARGLSRAGVAVISGMARGIDRAAHLAGLEGPGGTIAVLGSGLEQLYPKRHKRLADEIVAKGGALVSEFPLNMKPWPSNFPRRNRIISGLSHGVLVVEATQRSGSLES